MKIFVDTADINEIREAQKLGVVDGVTTNPTLISKTGRSFDEVVKGICREVSGPVSLEAISLDSEGLVAEAKKLSKISKNVVVKIPMISEGLKAVKILSKENIKTNVTLVFSPLQALLAAKAGASYVSPFVGRLDDIGHVGMDVVNQTLEIYGNYGFETEVIVASIRSPIHVNDAALMGAHVATIPFKVIQQLSKHPLTDIGIDKFLKDWEKVPK
ncbi:MAG: fructose-6-phosphate aldolase [Nitrospinota bacterium]|jgi:transaldolase|nr:fructose-6-phosphate aldolase [Nitrospinota bacterium]MDP7579786.1 fructose-6-phosphate aldolase [Nitrospinota bacterium]HJN02773.1 fructose-6-phosphate aldolase [Nitrospinota bacterium]